MNVASLLSGWTLDLFRITLRDGLGIKGRPADSVLNSGYRLYLLLGMPVMLSMGIRLMCVHLAGTACP